MATLENFALDISMDDKAYLRPGKDVGFSNTRNTTILTNTEEAIKRKLPQHDFPEKEINQTPSSFRLMTFRKENVQGKTCKPYIIIQEKGNQQLSIGLRIHLFWSGSSPCKICFY